MSGDTIIDFTDVSFECDCCCYQQMKMFYVCENKNDGGADLERLSHDINRYQIICPVCDNESFTADIKLSNQIANHRTTNCQGENDGQN